MRVFAGKQESSISLVILNIFTFKVERLYDFAVMGLNISSEQRELWIAPRRFNFAGADLDKKTWQGFWLFFFFCAMKFACPTFSMFGLMQRTKKGLEALSVAIRECRESWNTWETRRLRSRKLPNIYYIFFYVYLFMHILLTLWTEIKSTSQESSWNLYFV